WRGEAHRLMDGRAEAPLRRGVPRPRRFAGAKPRPQNSIEALIPIFSQALSPRAQARRRAVATRQSMVFLNGQGRVCMLAPRGGRVLDPRVWWEGGPPEGLQGATRHRMFAGRSRERRSRR